MKEKELPNKEELSKKKLLFLRNLHNSKERFENFRPQQGKRAGDVFHNMFHGVTDSFSAEPVFLSGFIVLCRLPRQQVCSSLPGQVAMNQDQSKIIH